MGSRRLKLRVRPASPEDCERLYNWANDPLTRKMSFRQAPIPWESHQRWFAAKLEDPNCLLLIMLGPDRSPIGQARFDLNPQGLAEIAFSLAPEARGHGYGGPALRAALRCLRSTHRAHQVVALIKFDNVASLRAFESAGFGGHRIVSRDGERVIRLLRSVDAGPTDRLREKAWSALERSLEPARAELRGAPFGARLKAALELGFHRSTLRELTLEERTEWYRQFAHRHPSYFRAHSFLGHALLADGALEEAAAAFEHALESAPLDPGVHAGIRALLSRRALPVPPVLANALLEESDPPRHLLNHALESARSAGNSELAERLARRLKRFHPDGPTGCELEATVFRARVLELTEDSVWGGPARWFLDGSRQARSPMTTSPVRPVSTTATAAALPQLDLVTLLNELEEALPVDEWKVNGVTVWPVLRNQIGGRLLSISQDLAPRHTTPSQAAPAPEESAWAVLRQFEFHREQLAYLRRHELLFVGFTSQRQPFEGRWYDRSFDPIRDVLDDLGKSSVHLESDRSLHPPPAPRHRPALQIQPYVDAILRGAPKMPLWEVQLPGWEQLVHRLSEYKAPLGDVPWLAPTPNRWAASLRDIFEVAEYFDFVLSRVRPRAVFTTVYYSVLGFALCWAGARRGVPVVDVQHGMTTRHYAYEAWRRVPRAGYPMLPSVFWSWTERDADRIASWSSACTPHHRSIVGGHPWNALLSRAQGPSQAAKAQLQAMRGPKLAVLVSLNWSYGFAEVFKEVMGVAGPEVAWWVRLHPIMRSQIPEVAAWCRDHLRGPHQVEVVTDLPLEPLLEAADVHLTLSSSVTQEATRAGLPTVCLEPRSQWLYAEEITSGWVQYVSGGPSEILQALKEQAHRRGGLSRWDPFPPPARLAEAVSELLGR